MRRLVLAVAVAISLLLSGCGLYGDGAVSACVDYLGVDDYDVEKSDADSTGDDQWTVNVYYESGAHAGTCHVELDGGYYYTSFSD